VIELAIGAGTGLMIFGIGYLSGRTGRAHAQPPPPRPDNERYRCGCGHHLALHDPQTGICNGSVEVQEWSKKADDYIDVYRACGCRQYIGERPVDQAALAELFNPKAAEPPAPPE
jgi:hypothetical protein